MGTSFGALCTDFYINHKLALKMDLPSERETTLHFFEAVRKSVPNMDRFRRHKNELTLESSRREQEYRWLSMEQTTLRTGHVNPQSMSQAYDFHRLVLELAPYHLTISPLEIDFQEVMFGFDLECKADHDEVVFDALLGDTPFAKLLAVPHGKILDVQPVLGVALTDKGDTQAYFEVKTRTKSRRGSASRFKHEPISLFLTVRQYGPAQELDDLIDVLAELADKTEALATDYFIPDFLTPITRQITSSNA